MRSDGYRLEEAVDRLKEAEVSTAAFRGANVVGIPKRSRRYREGRTCAHPGCITVLSVYNRRETCFNHAGVKIPRLRGRKTA